MERFISVLMFSLVMISCTVWIGFVGYEIAEHISSIASSALVRIP